MEYLEALNRALFLKINAGPSTAQWLIEAATIIADDLIYLIPILLCAMWLWAGDGRRRLAVRACLTALVGLGLNQVIGALWLHPRPFAIGLGQAWLAHAPDSSFPSDHVTIFSGIGLTLLFGGSTARGIATLLTGLCVAWARVFLGVHFPLDMVGAVAVACVAYGVISPLWRAAGEPLVHLFERVYRALLARPIALGWMRR